jgi:hypothetical protein
MTIPRPADGHGSTLIFAGFLANIISIATPTMKRNAIDATHLGSVDTMDAIPAKLIDAGEVSIDVEFDPALVPPIQGTAQTLAIQWASTVPATWTWPSAFVTSVKLPNVKSGEKLTATIGFKLIGLPVVS